FYKSSRERSRSARMGLLAAGAQLHVGALQTGLLALPGQRVLLDELVAWAAVQAELQTPVVLCVVQVVLRHADGKSQVAAYTPDDDGSANVTGLDLHLPAHSGAATLHDGQAAALAAAASPVLKSQWQILSGGLVHFLICTAVIGLKDHCDLQQREADNMILWIKTSSSF
uniref:Uncharacterized protein n=1 Tax=Echeneis naucrates TaxID=173247 RepID=A0A665WTW6_ECHNA